jgi:hypothetical protein
VHAAAQRTYTGVRAPAAADASAARSSRCAARAPPRARRACLHRRSAARPSRRQAGPLRHTLPWRPRVLRRAATASLAAQPSSCPSVGGYACPRRRWRAAGRDDAAGRRQRRAFCQLRHAARRGLRRRARAFRGTAHSLTRGKHRGRQASSARRQKRGTTTNRDEDNLKPVSQLSDTGTVRKVRFPLAVSLDGSSGQPKIVCTSSVPSVVAPTAGRPLRSMPQAPPAARQRALLHRQKTAALRNGAAVPRCCPAHAPPAWGAATKRPTAYVHRGRSETRLRPPSPGTRS